MILKISSQIPNRASKLSGLEFDFSRFGSSLCVINKFDYRITVTGGRAQRLLNTKLSVLIIFHNTNNSTNS